jgi:hypothetical protein
MDVLIGISSGILTSICGLSVLNAATRWQAFTMIAAIVGAYYVGRMMP